MKYLTVLGESHEPCQFLFLPGITPHQSLNLKNNGQCVEQVYEIKYLSFMLDPHLKFKETCLSNGDMVGKRKLFMS